MEIKISDFVIAVIGLIYSMCYSGIVPAVAFGILAYTAFHRIMGEVDRMEQEETDEY